MVPGYTTSLKGVTLGGYAITAQPTPGIIGTATTTINACVAAGSINNADISTLAVTIDNGF